MIQSAIAPGAASVNFGHGGLGSYGFLSWHRYFLHRLELQLQSNVPGVMIPYWDWTDPASMHDRQLPRPGRVAGTDDGQPWLFRRRARPGTGGNPTPAPALVACGPPDGLAACPRSSARGAGAAHARRRRTDWPRCPRPRTCARRSAWPRTAAVPEHARERQRASHSGNQMHNGLHGWIGGHMGRPRGLALRPDLLPAPLQHRPAVGDVAARWPCRRVPGRRARSVHHHRNDPMYPWVGALRRVSHVTPRLHRHPDARRLGARARAQRRHPRLPRPRLHVRHARGHRHRARSHGQHARA